MGNNPPNPPPGEDPKPPDASSDTVTLSKTDLAVLIADQIAKANAPLQDSMTKVMSGLAARPAQMPQANVDANLMPRTRGTIVRAEGTVAAAAIAQAFIAFNYRDYLVAAKPFAPSIKLNCERYGFSMLDAFIQLAHESGFNPLAESTTGALGLAQISAETAEKWHMDPTDPDASIRALVVHMKQYREKFAAVKDGRYGMPMGQPGEAQSFAALDLALAAWDAGLPAVEQANGIPPFPETQNYVAMIGGTVRAVLSNSTMRARWVEDWNALLR